MSELLALLAPAAVLLAVGAYHISPVLPSIRPHCAGRRNLPREAFGLPPLESRLSVRAAAMLLLTAAAAVALACGLVFGFVTQPLIDSGGGTLSAGAAALLAVSTLLLPVTSVVLGAMTLALRIFPTDSSLTTPPDTRCSSSLTTLVDEPIDTASTLHAADGVNISKRPTSQVPEHASQPKWKTLIAGEDRHMTHASALRAGFLGGLLTAALAGICAALPSVAGIILLGSGGAAAVSAVGLGVAGWSQRWDKSSRHSTLASKIEQAAKTAAAWSMAKKAADLTASYEVEDYEVLGVPGAHETCVYGTPAAARSEVARAAAELANASRAANSSTTLERPRNRRERRSWAPPTGSPSSWVTERSRTSQVAEWDFGASPSHSRSHGLSANDTLRSQSAVVEVSDGTLRGHGRSASLCSPHTRTASDSHRFCTIPASAGSRCADGSIVASYVPDPFQPLPPRAFESLTSISRIAKSSKATTANVDLDMSLDTTTDNILTVVNATANTTINTTANATANTSSSLPPRPDGPTPRTARQGPPPPVNTRLAHRMRTLSTNPDTANSAAPSTGWTQWTGISSTELLADAEWVPVEAPGTAEQWGARGDRAAGFVTVIGLILCFALEAPMLVLGPQAATLATFATSLALPAPLLAGASYLIRHKPSMVDQPRAPSTEPTAPATLTSKHIEPADLSHVDFSRIDYSQPRWSCLGHSGVEGISDGGGRSTRYIVPGLDFEVVLDPMCGMKQPGRAVPTTPRMAIEAWLAAGHARFAGPISRALEMLKPAPQLCITPPKRDTAQVRATRLRGGVVSICLPSARDFSYDGDEAQFVSIDLDATPPKSSLLESAEICTAIRAHSRCPSMVDVRALAGNPDRLVFTDSVQGVIVGTLTRSRQHPANEPERRPRNSYLVDTYTFVNASPREGGGGNTPRAVVLGSSSPVARPASAMYHARSDSSTSIDFAAACASTPLGKKKASATTTGSCDMAFDTECDFCTGPCGHGSFPPLAYGPRSTSNSKSAQVDMDAAAQENIVAEQSIAHNAEWARTLLEKLRTPSLASLKSFARARAPSTATIADASSTPNTPSTIARLSPAQETIPPVPPLPAVFVAPPELRRLPQLPPAPPSVMPQAIMSPTDRTRKQRRAMPPMGPKIFDVVADGDKPNLGPSTSTNTTHNPGLRELRLVERARDRNSLKNPLTPTHSRGASSVSGTTEASGTKVAGDTAPSSVAIRAADVPTTPSSLDLSVPRENLPSMDTFGVARRKTPNSTSAIPIYVDERPTAKVSAAPSLPNKTTSSASTKLSTGSTVLGNKTNLSSTSLPNATVSSGKLSTGSVASTRPTGKLSTGSNTSVRGSRPPMPDTSKTSDPALGKENDPFGNVRAGRGRRTRIAPAHMRV